MTSTLMTSALEVLHTPVGDAVQVSTQWFLDHILPPPPVTVSAQSILQRWKSGHKKSSSQKPITNQGRWKGFPHDPSLSSASGSSTFKHLTDIVVAISKAVPATDSGRTRFLRINPSPVGMVSSRSPRYKDSLPDAFFVSREAGGELDWADVEVVGEYEKTDQYGDAKAVSNQFTLSNTTLTAVMRQNMWKAISSMSRVMQADPRRRFVFGFTMENTNMRLWFCDRAQIVMS